MEPASASLETPALHFLSGRGQTGQRIRTLDWTQTALGNPATWEQSLQTCVRIMLASPLAMFVLWTEEKINIYNDSFAALVGEENLPALGLPINGKINELWQNLLQDSEGFEGEQSNLKKLVVEQNGRKKEVYIKCSCSSVMADDGKLKGLFYVCTDETKAIKSENALQELQTRHAANSTPAREEIPLGAEASFARVTADKTIKEREENKNIKESLDRFQHLISEATVGIIVLIGEEMWVEVVNNTYAKLINRTVEDILNKKLFECIPETESYFRPIIDGVRKSGEPVYLYGTPYFVWVDGKKKEGFLNLVYQPYKEIDGSLSGVMVLCQDVTEQVLSGRKIEESEERFRSFSNNIQNLAWMADGDGSIYWYNQRWYDFTGTTLEEMKGWGWEKVHHPDHVEWVVNRVRNGWTLPEPFELTFPLRGADGNYRWFLTRCVPIVNATGKITNWVGTNTDINDQVLAEEKIKESENMFRTLADTLPQLIWMTDEKGKYMYASAQWYEYTGVNPSLENASEQFVHPADMQALLKVWKNSLQSGATYYAEARLKSKHGEYRWHFVKGEPVKSDDGKVIKWIGAFTDINDQKTLNQKLEQLVTERTRELARSNEDLQQFAHVASHDLKEPVRKVRTFISRMQVEFGNELPERVKTYLSKIEGAANRMYAMIDGVLLYSTLSTGEKAFEQIDLNETISSIASDLEVLIYQKDAVIEYDHLPTFQGSPILIYQLFYNLLTNSLKFTSPNTKPFITIKSETWLKNKELQGNSFKITVRDNGIGFRQDHAEKIFQTFARLNPKDKYEGTGLGLALCKKIVERHSGSISAKGEVGKGACFEIVLPTASVEN